MNHEVPERFIDWLDDEEITSLLNLAVESGSTITVTEIVE